MLYAGTMAFMYFKGDVATSTRAKDLNLRAIAAPCQYDRDMMSKYGLIDQLDRQLFRVYDNGFSDDELLKIFRNDQNVYKELVVEFIASFKFECGLVGRNFNTRKCIRFRLCGNWYDMSLLEFGIHLGLQDPSINNELYQDHLDKAYIEEAPTYTLRSCWQQIGMVEYDPKHAREAHLKDPLIRLIHRYLAWTTLFHSQPERLNEDHLKGLYFCVNREYRWNIPYAMASMFKATQTTNGRELPGGNSSLLLPLNWGF